MPPGAPPKLSVSTPLSIPLLGGVTFIGRLSWRPLSFPAAGQCRPLADTVEKVFFGWWTKFSSAADAFRARRREGPHRFTQKRS